jgi:N-acetylmuramoyl-L-alanine amidase
MYVHRPEWGAAAPTRRPTPIPTPTPNLWLHHSAGAGTNKAAVKAVQRLHMQTRGWSDIAYSFLIGDDIYEGRGVGWDHLTSDPKRSHAICMLGNYDTGRVPAPIIDRTAWLVAHGLLAGWWVTGLTGGHKDIPGGNPSACPGRYGEAAIPVINAKAAEIIAGIGGAPIPPPPVLEEDDMYGDLDRIRDQIAAEQTAAMFRFLATPQPDGSRVIPSDHFAGTEAILTTNAKVGDLWGRPSGGSGDCDPSLVAAATADELAARLRG